MNQKKIRRSATDNLKEVFPNFYEAAAIANVIMDWLQRQNYEWDELLLDLFSWFVDYCPLGDAFPRSAEAPLVSEAEKFQEYMVQHRKYLDRKTKSSSVKTGSPKNQETQSLFTYPEWMSKFRVFDLVMVNLTWKILSDIRREQRPQEGIKLIDLCENHATSIKKDPTDLSRHPLKKYPPLFQRYFGISKNGNKPYTIKTNFPDLLAILIKSQSLLPFFDNNPPRTLRRDICLLEAGLSVIAPNETWAKDSYISYYFFERFFRLNTKMRLFDEWNNSEKDTRSSTISPPLAADFFFSSPIVFIPNEYLHSFLNSHEALYAFIQISAYYLPAIECMAKSYLLSHKLYTCEAVEHYLFPTEEKWAEWIKRYSDFTPSALQDDTSSRGKCNIYRAKWHGFSPPYEYRKSSYRMQYLYDWANKDIPDFYTEYDRAALAEVQRNLPPAFFNESSSKQTELK